MMGLSRDQALDDYQTVASHGGVAAADPHGLVLMLRDGALERTARLRIAIVEKNYTEKARAINRTLGILDLDRHHEVKLCVDVVGLHFGLAKVHPVVDDKDCRALITVRFWV